MFLHDMKKPLPPYAPLFLLAVLPLILSLIAVPGLSEEPSPIRILTLSSEPFFYLNGEGEPAGLEYDLLQGFAGEQGRELEILWADNFAGMLLRLSQGDVDLAVSGITINEEREERFDFSDPYFPALALLVERREEESVEIAALSGKRVLMLPGTTHEEILQAVSGIKVTYGENAAEMFEQVAAGKADALAVDSTDYLWYAEDFPALTATLRLSEREFYGFAMPQGSSLKAPLDAYLKSVRTGGRYQEILRAAYGEWGYEMIDEMSEGFLDP